MLENDDVQDAQEHSFHHRQTPVNPLKLFDIAKSQHRPLYTSAPMVRYSKLAFRQTVFEYDTDLCWTPMILAKEFVRSSLARDADFTLSPRPVPTVVQFGASSAEDFARAALVVGPYVSGVDLNCGCPQSWACAESLGAALMAKRALVASMVKTAKSMFANHGLHSQQNTSPNGEIRYSGCTVSVKIRIHHDLRETIDFVKTVQDAGIDFITIHGRTRRQRSSEPVNLDAIRLVAEHCHAPVIANGDVVSLARAKEIASLTNVQGVMSSRAILANPALYAGFQTCPWEAVVKFMDHVIDAPLPFKLVQHHLNEMVSDGGWGVGQAHALVSRQQKVGLMSCKDMLDLIDWYREICRHRDSGKEKAADR